MTTLKLGVAAAALATLVGCASSSKDIVPAYSSDMMYQSYSCSSMEAEAERIGGRMQELGAQVDQKAQSDAMKTGIALVLFWPAAFLIDGDGPEAAEYAKLMGRTEALETAAIKKQCIDVEVAKYVPVKRETVSANDEYTGSDLP